MRFNLFFATLMSIGLSLFSYSQNIELVNPTLTPSEAITDVLLGAGVVASNITMNGSAANVNNSVSYVSQFNNGGGIFPIENGIVLRTLSAPSVSDPDLQAIGGNITNGVVLEFDFIPDGNFLSFNYVFASAEYQSYTCSSFNDVFGFFISGPGINGPYSNNAMNIATIPNSDNIPVGINTVNSGSASPGYSGSTCANVNPNWQSDSQYWTNSYNGTMSSLSSSITGSTVVLPAETDLVCGETYHIKLALSNVGDQSFNSAVFLEANSFSAAGVDISIQTNTSTSDTVLIAGCTEGTVYFTRPSFLTDDTLNITFHTGGDLVEGEHYPWLADGDSVITFLPGEDSITVVIGPYPNDMPGDPHELTIYAYSVNECGDTVYSQGTIWVINEPYSIVTALDTTVYCATDSIPIWVETYNQYGLEPYTYTWEPLGDPGNILHEGEIFITGVEENGTYEYLVTSTDACGFEYVDTVTIIMDQTLSIDSLEQYPADCGINNGVVVGYSSGFTGTPHYTWTDSNIDTIPGNTIEATVWENRSPGWYYFIVEDDVCSVIDSIFVEQLPPPHASFDADPVSGFSPLTVSFTNTSDHASEYYWTFGNGNDTTMYNLGNPNDQTYYEEGEYTVTLILTEGGCTDMATKVIMVEEYLPITYNYPNVFTPNGDGQNDFFHIEFENAAALELVILNRWGNIVFETDEIYFKWNGRHKNTGAECNDGTYFYKYTVTDFYGVQYKEHGFIHLAR